MTRHIKRKETQSEKTDEPSEPDMTGILELSDRSGSSTNIAPDFPAADIRF